jgi:hypothetical protein
MLLARQLLERFLKLKWGLLGAVESRPPSSFPSIRQNFDDRSGWVVDVELRQPVTKISKGWLLANRITCKESSKTALKFPTGEAPEK